MNKTWGETGREGERGIRPGERREGEGERGIRHGERREGEGERGIRHGERREGEGERGIRPGGSLAEDREGELMGDSIGNMFPV